MMSLNIKNLHWRGSIAVNDQHPKKDGEEKYREENKMNEKVLKKLKK